MTIEENNTPHPSSVEERLANIEGTIASSWALKTRSEYEQELKGRLKDEILNYASKVGISTLILISGAGFLFIKSAITDVYEEKNKIVIADLKQKYEANYALELQRFEWKRNHDYGKNYIYLAKFYAESGVLEQNAKRSKIMDEQFTRARTYFEYALRTDPQQASTYWELGELYNNYAKTFNATNWIDIQKSFYYYTEPVSLFSAMEISKGWRADTYWMAATTCMEIIGKGAKIDPSRCSLLKAQEYLTLARTDYQKAIPESVDYNATRMKDVDNLLIQISSKIGQSDGKILNGP